MALDDEYMDDDDVGDEVERVREMLFDVIEEQMEKGEPPEVEATLTRLVAGGMTAGEAMRHIAVVLMLEMNDLVREKRPFSMEKYVEDLNRLPELPGNRLGKRPTRRPRRHH